MLVCRLFVISEHSARYFSVWQTAQYCGKCAINHNIRANSPKSGRYSGDYPQIEIMGQDLTDDDNVNVVKSNKCNQCNYASSHAGHLRTHLKTHSGEKPNKCNQCDFACSDPSSLSQHLKRHSAVKSNKCNQCDYASSYQGDLKNHLKMHRRT